MRQTVRDNLKEIKKFYKKKLIYESNIYLNSINKEMKEWIDDSFEGTDEIWTLPDLTRIELFDNFCRSIKKRISKT